MLVTRGEIGAPPLELIGREIAHGIEQRRLQAREREVEPRHTGDRERVGLRVALPREAIDLGPTGIRQPEQPRALVEGLARGIVERTA